MAENVVPAEQAAQTDSETPAPVAAFPAETPIIEMTAEQQAAYWKHHARRHEDNAKAYKGVTPDQVRDMQTELAKLKDDKLTADERAVNQARTEARAAAEAELLPKVRAAEVKAIASDVISGDRLRNFMDFADPAKFIGDNGEIDEAKVMGALTGMFGAQPAKTPVVQAPRWQNAGQFAPPPAPAKPGEAGRAEAARRHSAKPK
ncbi:hypothetical protein D5S18_18600 [Nocardia panacis]|uniref:DUF4355 domain-containing protein n=1 Tax=Nocardia panacis TaxID=2340916 RepID=A0A3A4KME6_9NOCA|nr:hypothetical protein [Nocardia panacis]RJO74164.1 hypothetical protein D5S18_18600 [Nocardia panacis]